MLALDQILVLGHALLEMRPPKSHNQVCDISWVITLFYFIEALVYIGFILQSYNNRVFFF